MFRANKEIIRITEQTVRQLMTEIERAKSETTFTHSAMPNDNMSLETFFRLKRERGEIMVSSEHAPVDFFVSLEV